LVEWQLTHSQYIKSVIDVAWGVRAYKHKKKVEGELTGPPPPDDPNSVENLLLQPFGQDINRKRYWILDGPCTLYRTAASWNTPCECRLTLQVVLTPFFHSTFFPDSPRIWVSGNPWKLACSFAVASSTREEFLEVIADLKRHAPPDSDVEKDRRLKFETTHIELLKDLETVQLPKIDLALAVSLFNFPVLLSYLGLFGDTLFCSFPTSFLILLSASQSRGRKPNKRISS
jgi:hypothetical protein